MAANQSRTEVLQKRRMMQVAFGVACLAFVGLALGAVMVDRSIEPAPELKLPPPPQAGGSEDQAETWEPYAPLIATGLSSVYELDPVKEPVENPGPGEGKQPPPQDIVLVAAIGQPGSMMAVIREGAAQTAIAEGQRGGSVDVLEVAPGYARVRYRGEERELRVGTPTLMVSDMGVSGEVPTGSQIVTPPGASSRPESLEEQGVTRTRTPTAMQRAQSGATPGGGQGGQSGRGGGGNSGTSRRGAGAGNGNGNGNGQAQGAEDDR
ncbi:MAG: hypothetical protein ACIAS6_02760 [Phycisphaerales bacterium JB060]